MFVEKPDLAMKQSIELFPYNRDITTRACLILDDLHYQLVQSSVHAWHTLMNAVWHVLWEVC